MKPSLKDQFEVKIKAQSYKDLGGENPKGHFPNKELFKNWTQPSLST